MIFYTILFMEYQLSNGKMAEGWMLLESPEQCREALMASDELYSLFGKEKMFACRETGYPSGYTIRPRARDELD